MKRYYGGPIGITKALSTVPTLTPYGLLFPKIGDRNPNPKLQSLLSQKRVKLRTSNLAGTVKGSTQSEQKPIQNFGKRERGRIQVLPQFLITPIISGFISGNPGHNPPVDIIPPDKIPPMCINITK